MPSFSIDGARKYTPPVPVRSTAKLHKESMDGKSVMDICFKDLGATVHSIIESFKGDDISELGFEG